MGVGSLGYKLENGDLSIKTCGVRSELHGKGLYRKAFQQIVTADRAAQPQRMPEQQVERDTIHGGDLLPCRGILARHDYLPIIIPQKFRSRRPPLPPPQRAATALEAIGKKQQDAENMKRQEDAQRATECSPMSAEAHEIEGESLQKSLQSGDSREGKHRRRIRKLLKRIGSSGRTRTYNPSVNSRMLYH